MKKRTIFIAYSVVLFLTMIVFEAVAKRLDPGWGKHPIERLFEMYIGVIFYLGYVLYSWKSDLAGFLKRFYIAIPFAVLFSIIVKALGYDIYWSTLGGMFLSILLLLKTPNGKKHFLVILVAACVYVLFATWFFRLTNPGDESQVNSFAVEQLVFLGLVLIHSFLLLYLARIVNEEGIPDLKPIVIRSVKFSVALSLFWSAYLVLNFNDRLALPFPFQLMVNTFLALGFIVVSYKFDFLLIERKRWPQKRNRIGESEWRGHSQEDGEAFPL